jgi:hypothetical protein
MDALENLAAQADSMGAPPPAGSATAPEAHPVSLDELNTNGLCALLAMLRELTATPLIFTPPLRTLKVALADDKLPALAGPWARVLAHYGIDLSAQFDHPVALALLTTGPQLWAIVGELREELKARQAKPVQAEPAPDSADPGRAE